MYSQIYLFHKSNDTDIFDKIDNIIEWILFNLIKRN